MYTIRVVPKSAIAKEREDDMVGLLMLLRWVCNIADRREHVILSVARTGQIETTVFGSSLSMHIAIKAKKKNK